MRGEVMFLALGALSLSSAAKASPQDRGWLEVSCSVHNGGEVVQTFDSRLIHLPGGYPFLFLDQTILLAGSAEGLDATIHYSWNGRYFSMGRWMEPARGASLTISSGGREVAKDHSPGSQLGIEQPFTLEAGAVSCNAVVHSIQVLPAIGVDYGYRFDPAEGFCHLPGRHDVEAYGTNPGVWGECGDVGGSEALGTNPGTDIPSYSVAGRNLRGMSLYGAKLPGIDLSGADLTEVGLNGQIMPLDLKRANLRGAILDSAMSMGGWNVHLDDADLTLASIQDADLSNITAERASFRGANLSRSNFHSSTLNGADFSHADLRGTRLSWIEYEGAVFRGARFNGTTVLPFSREEALALGMIESP